MSHSTISRWLDRHDIDREPRYRDRTWLYEEYVENRRHQDEIADECGVGKTTICHWLARFGITDNESLDTDECLTCGETFRYYPSVRDGQFCSNECAKDQDKRQVTITCQLRRDVRASTVVRYGVLFDSVLRRRQPDRYYGILFDTVARTT